ncbi:Methionine-binding lipoprotein MetQ [Candidatus Hepatincola sp. Pdp]
MKYLFYIIFLVFLNLSALWANSTLVVGASAVPHAEILEFVKPYLKKSNINLKIVIFQDYILPNKALATGDIQANFFQHEAYLEAQIKQNDYNFVAVAKVHIEPMGIYSKNYTSLQDIKLGSQIIFSNSVADRGRVLLLLQAAGLIKLKQGIKITALDISDIIYNPKNLSFVNNVDPAMLPQIYNRLEGVTVINTNYALEAGMNPLKDALFLEPSNSPYVNILVTTKELQNDPKIQALVKVLKSKETKDFILKKYKGAIVPAS